MKKLALLLMVFAFAKAYSQELSGIATYQSQRSIDLDLGEGMDNAMQKQIQEQLKKQFQKTYALKFNGAESFYSEEDGGIGVPQPSTNGGISVVVSQGKDVTYRDIVEGKYVNQADLMGKMFLIHDELKKKEWKLGKETKKIGVYTCFKATYEEEVEASTITQEGKHIKEKKMKTTTAWYTLDVPVQHGPDRYWGLPGLILEIQDGEFSLMCTKVVLNREEKLDIEEPKKGKLVTGEEFQKISQEKSEEMMERYSGGRKKGDNSAFSIKIGG